MFASAKPAVSSAKRAPSSVTLRPRRPRTVTASAAAAGSVTPAFGPGAPEWWDIHADLKKRGVRTVSTDEVGAEVQADPSLKAPPGLKL